MLKLSQYNPIFIGNDIPFKEGDGKSPLPIEGNVARIVSSIPLIIIVNSTLADLNPNLTISSIGLTVHDA